LRSRRRPFAWLLRKEWRELTSSRAWWALLALTGPLVGVSFISAVNTYAEVSTGAGAGCGFVCNPLDGIWAPTFSAYEIAAIFLLPFVAIRVVGGDRQSGAFAIEVQRTISPFTRISAKAIVLLAGWALTGGAALLALVLWLAYGGSAYAPEILVAATGHLLNAGITIALAAAAASVTDHPSTAAIATLAVTVGLWMIDFASAIQGGIWTTMAEFTPTALVASFQHGLVQVNIVLIAMTAIAAGLGVAALWMRPSVPVGRRGRDAALWLTGALAIGLACTAVRGSWDASESRRNSFPESDQEALAAIRTPLKIEVHLAPGDGRRQQFDAQPLAKLKRTMPHVSVAYVSRSSTGLYESADPGYGEIWYELGGHRVMSHQITDEGVLETVMGLAGLTPGAETEDEFHGHPLAAHPTGAAVLFYGVWPVLLAGLGVAVLRKNR
jgi:hypothetical protein